MVTYDLKKVDWRNRIAGVINNFKRKLSRLGMMALNSIMKIKVQITESVVASGVAYVANSSIILIN